MIVNRRPNEAEILGGVLSESFADWYDDWLDGRHGEGEAPRRLVKFADNLRKAGWRGPDD